MLLPQVLTLTSVAARTCLAAPVPRQPWRDLETAGQLPTKLSDSHWKGDSRAIMLGFGRGEAGVAGCPEGAPQLMKEP